jgi:glycosyltransferase involved in cell wall biosynthesis
MIDVSVILPTYNPNISRLNQALAGLQQQTLNLNQWELIVIDNNSSIPVNVDLSWHPNHKIVKEQKPGLTNARLEGFQRASGPFIVMVDDDNILDNDYLKNVLSIFKSNPKLGAIGGKSIPLFENTPPGWLKEFYSNLALRDLGEEVLLSTWENVYPPTAPIGAGMGINKVALKSYNDKITNGGNIITDRSAGSLTSGGDNDIVLEIIKSGWQVGYFPSLQLTHIIPKERTKVNYLVKLINNTNKSWVQLLESHHINLWEKIPAHTVPLRKIKAWFIYRAWQNKVNYIKWHGACGLYDGLAE